MQGKSTPGQGRLCNATCICRGGADGGGGFNFKRETMLLSAIPLRPINRLIKAVSQGVPTVCPVACRHFANNILQTIFIFTLLIWTTSLGIYEKKKNRQKNGATVMETCIPPTLLISLSHKGHQEPISHSSAPLAGLLGRSPKR